MFSSSPLYWSFMAALSVSAALALILIGYVWPRRSAPGSMPLLGMLTAVTFWSIGYIIEYANNQVDGKLLAMDISYIGTMTLPLMLFAFSFRFTNRGKWISPRVYALLLIVPAITLILQFTKTLQPWLYYDYHLVQDGPFLLLAKQYGFWFWVAGTYNYVLLIASIAVLVDRLLSPPRLFIDQAIYLLIAMIVPTLANLEYLFKFVPMPHADWTPAAFTVSAVMLTLAISRHRFLEILPIARESAIELMSEGFLVLDDKERIVDFNKAMLGIIGMGSESVHGEHLPGTILSQLKSNAGYDGYQRSSTEVSLEVDKQARCFSVHFSPLQIDMPRACGHVLVFYDVTERKRAEETIKQIAYYDHLTGLPNRLLLSDRAEQALSSAHRYGRKTAIMIIDIDHFKQINDTYGHSEGDQVLQDMASRFSNSVRKVDTVSRLGGDEFIVLLPEILGDDTPQIIAQRIIGAVSVPFNISGKEITLSTSIGIAVFPDDAPALHQLIKCADAAMYHVKQSGRNGYTRYCSNMGTQTAGSE